MISPLGLENLPAPSLAITGDRIAHEAWLTWPQFGVPLQAHRDISPVWSSAFRRGYHCDKRFREVAQAAEPAVSQVANLRGLEWPRGVGMKLTSTRASGGSAWPRWALFRERSSRGEMTWVA